MEYNLNVPVLINLPAHTDNCCISTLPDTTNGCKILKYIFWYLRTLYKILFLKSLNRSHLIHLVQETRISSHIFPVLCIKMKRNHQIWGFDTLKILGFHPSDTGGMLDGNTIDGSQSRHETAMLVHKLSNSKLWFMFCIITESNSQYFFLYYSVHQHGCCEVRRKPSIKFIFAEFG